MSIRTHGPRLTPILATPGAMRQRSRGYDRVDTHHFLLAGQTTAQRLTPAPAAGVRP